MRKLLENIVLIQLFTFLSIIPFPAMAVTKQPKGCAKWSYSKVIKEAKPYLSFIERRTKGSLVSKELVTAIIVSESCFVRTAESQAGAVGLMQLIPATATRFGVVDRLDAHQNIKGGIRYLNFLAAKFRRLDKVIAGYNAGEGAVMKYGGVPPYRETKQYLVNVLHVYRLLKGKGLPPAPSAAGLATPTHEQIQKDLFRLIQPQPERINTKLVSNINGFVKWKASSMTKASSGFK